jgi:hypothetical protein
MTDTSTNTTLLCQALFLLYAAITEITRKTVGDNEFSDEAFVCIHASVRG